MPTFLRSVAPGGTFFFTVVTFDRRPILTTPVARVLLRDAIEETRCRRPFRIEAIVVLPDHLHTMWTLPEGDADFSTRWRKIKEAFTRQYLAAGRREKTVSKAKRAKGLRGIWQPRFWEHTIRDERDFAQHMHYIHYNPVRHGQSTCPHDWPYSTFHRWVKEGVYAPDWCRACNKRATKPPDCHTISSTVGE